MPFDAGHSERGDEPCRMTFKTIQVRANGSGIVQCDCATHKCTSYVAVTRVNPRGNVICDGYGPILPPPLGVHRSFEFIDRYLTCREKFLKPDGTVDESKRNQVLSDAIMALLLKDADRPPT